MKRHFQVSRTKPNAPATTSSVLPSGLTFVDDFQGNAAAISEFSLAVGAALDQMTLGADQPPQLRQMVYGLDREGSTYSNSKVNERDPCSEWKCSRAQAQLVSLAWNCAYETYNSAEETIDTSQYSIQSNFVETLSLGESVTAWTSTLVSPISSHAEPNEFLPVLVVAIQGSSNNMDHLSTSPESRDVHPFINPGLAGASSLFANGNFLAKAQVLAESILLVIQQYANTPDLAPKHVLFTGHSAGGAVASLLLLHFISKGDLSGRVRFSCITFGSPPSVTAPIELSSYQMANPSTMAINLINEFDLICRADSIYMMSLVNLVRSTYGQPPVPLIHGASDSKQSSSTSREPSKAISRGTTSSSRNIWPVPKLSHHHVGSRLALLMRLDEDDVQLRVFDVPSGEFEKVLFCRLFTHNMMCYAERIRLIRDGIFNRRGGWTGKEVQAPINPKCL